MSPYRPHPLDHGEPPSWASAWGEDRYGVFVVFSVGEAEQRMRWIPPGTFWMGSPETEEGRDNDEVRHRVTLTKGFWLGDTPCTQELWQVVMGKNPSRFVSPDRPVEQVSWDDARAFLEELREKVPGLEPRLPTEAEWEYACRAGTEEATYVGDLEILGANNAPVLDAVAWYGGNSGEGFELEEGSNSSFWSEKQYAHTRSGSRPVALKGANPWGLYDTLGNVCEWCEDWYGANGSGPVTNPRGPSQGTSRVIRGGSWNIIACHVRAAYRIHGGPAGRSHDLGFRLARDQV